MIMSVVNWSGKMSARRDERKTGFELAKAEAVGGPEGGGKMAAEKPGELPPLGVLSRPGSDS
jgi:hypothetical protein